jgi:hypothetical protein
MRDEDAITPVNRKTATVSTPIAIVTSISVMPERARLRRRWCGADMGERLRGSTFARVALERRSTGKIGAAGARMGALRPFGALRGLARRCGTWS